MIENIVAEDKIVKKYNDDITLATTSLQSI